MLQEVLADRANHVPALLRLGRLHRSRGDPAKSTEAFRAALELQPDYAPALIEIARDTWAAGDPTAARNFLARALSQEPSNLAAIIASAELALLAGDATTALQSARRAIELHPGQIGPYLLGARAAVDLFARDEAQELLDLAYSTFGFRPEIAAGQIHLLRQYRDYDAARAVIAKGGEQAAANFGFWIEATSFSIAQGEFYVAEKALNSAPAISTKEVAHVHFLVAQLAEGRRQYAKAVTSYDAAIALDDSHVEWHEAAARCCLLLADTNRTRGHLRAAMILKTAVNVARGKSSNISQHHLGQLLDEFALHRETLDELQLISELPPEVRIDPLRRLVRDDPEQTAPALLLVLAMRQAGLFSSDRSCPCPVSSPVIPRRIVHYWHDGNPPPDVHEIMDSWYQKHPEYEQLLLDDTTRVDLLARAGCGYGAAGISQGVKPRTAR